MSRLFSHSCIIERSAMNACVAACWWTMWERAPETLCRAGQTDQKTWQHPSCILRI